MAKTATSSTTHKDIINAVKQRQFLPVYLLMGDESYYIDLVSQTIADSVLTEEELGFNQMTIYCTKETDVHTIIDTAKRYPMMSEYQVVIVKEAQNLLKIEELTEYVQNPLSSTILVICHKNGSVDKRKKLVGAVQKVGVILESNKVKDAALPAFITDYLKDFGITIDNTARMMLAEYVGTDLNRLVGELDKLRIAIAGKATTITPADIEQNIGISKEYNIWELQTAVLAKDVMKVNQIMHFFDSNPKLYPPIQTLSMLFRLFANIMQAFYAPQRTEQSIAEYLGMSTWQVRSIIPAMRLYSGVKTMQIIGKVREADAKLKGVGKGNATDSDIMKELMFFILH